MRKTFFNIVFFVLLVLLTLTRPTQSNPSLPTCAFSNAYTAHLKSAGVRFLFTPVKAYQNCGSEWASQGTCCQASSINRFVNREKKELDSVIKLAENQVELTITVINRYILQLRNYIEKEAKNEKSLNTLGRIPTPKLTNRQRNELRTNLVPEISPILKWINENKEDMVKKQKECVARLGEVRLNSICFTCSSRAKAFFQGDSLNVHEMTCRGIISQCSQSWYYLIAYLDRVNKFNGIIRELEQREGIKFTEAVSGSPAKSILDWADKNNLRENLAQCKDGLCRFDIAKYICENFVSIRNPIYLKQALNIVSSVIDKSQFIYQSLSSSQSPAPTAGTTSAAPQTSSKAVSASTRPLSKKEISKAKAQDEEVKKLVKGFMRKSHSIRAGGRKLVLRTGQKAAPVLKAVAKAVGQVVASVAATAQSFLQNSNSNPFLCASTSICIADKVVLPVSKCGTFEMMCTDSNIQYSSP